MAKVQVKPNRPVYPTPAGLVTSVDEDGRPNIITLGEIFNISIETPVILGIAIRKVTYTHGLISKTREYVVNLPKASILDQVLYCGSVTGSEVDKFRESGLTPLPATFVKPPLIAECPVNIECKVLDILEIGDHDLFLGEAMAQHVDEEVLDERGRIVPSKLDGYANVLGQMWTFGQRVVRHR